MAAHNRPRRVLVQANSLELGGSQINAVELADAVRAFGYESVVVGPKDSIRPGPSLLDVARDRGIQVDAFDRPMSTLSGARMLNRLARRHHADLVHVYGSWSIRPAFWGPALAARRPLVVTVYEMKVDEVVNEGTPLIVGTGYLLDEQSQSRRGSVHLISPPVDTAQDSREVPYDAFLSDHALDPRNTRIVVVSRLDGLPLRPSKTQAVEDAITAMTLLDRPDLDLVVVGAGFDFERLSEHAERANRRLGRKACHLIGPLADPRPAYASADVVLGMGGSAARSLSFSKPLVVTGEFGWYQTFTPETSRALYRNSFWSEEVGDDGPRLLAAQLSELLSDPARRQSLGEFGRRFAVQNFDLRQMAQRLASVYDQSFDAYRLGDWAHDFRRESQWAKAWLAKRLPVSGRRAEEARRWAAGVEERSAYVETEPSSSHAASAAAGAESKGRQP